jgi:protein phosphatase
MLLSSHSGQQPHSGQQLGVETLSLPTSVTKLYCPNCGTENLESNQICLNCQAVLPKRYLWGVGGETLPVGTAIGSKNRFFVKAPGLFLDTQPGVLSPESPGISEAAMPYLKLFAYRLHIPQIFAIIPNNGTEILLLENTPLSAQDYGATLSKAGDLKANDLKAGELEDPTAFEGQGLATPFSQAWPSAGLVRQLNWLWQIAQLWQPFALEGVASSLLQVDLMRVEGPLLRIRQLTADQPNPTGPSAGPVTAPPPPQLADLGRVWQTWLSTTQLALQPGLETLCGQLIDGSINSAELVVLQLEQWFDLATKGVDGSAMPLRFDSATRTDQGPSRKRNEDACYPASGTHLSNTTEVLTIVCDGVGGHAGGDVASSSAIATIQSQLNSSGNSASKVSGQPASLPQLEMRIAAAICEANNLICEKNDSEHRQERQRMGTTVVLVLAQHHQVHIAHVGDSRVYWINRHGCYPMTLDDDVACREVRLGYTLYREVLQHPIAGSLVQALGMSGSENLHPNVSRWMLDEDCVFLLCSDGLSDYDRVEEAWQDEILPLLEGERDIITVRDRLVELANTYNGHDNVTVSLVHCQVNTQSLLAQTQTGQATAPLPQPTPETIRESIHQSRTTLESPALATPTQEERSFLTPEEPDARGRSPLFSILMVGLLIGILGTLTLILRPLLKEMKFPFPEGSPSSSPVEETSSPIPSPSTSPTSPAGVGGEGGTRSSPSNLPGQPPASSSPASEGDDPEGADSPTRPTESVSPSESNQPDAREAVPNEPSPSSPPPGRGNNAR